MSRIISSNEQLLLGSGINSISFLKGYDPVTKVFDKSKTQMGESFRLSTMKIDSSIFQRMLDGEDLFFDYAREGKRATFDHKNYFPEEGIYWASSWAKVRADGHRGERLLILMKFPDCQIEGIDYKVQEGESESSHFAEEVYIYPAKVKIHKVMRIARPSRFNWAHFPMRLHLEEVGK